MAPATEALNVLDRFTAAFNRQDPDAMDALESLADREASAAGREHGAAATPGDPASG